MWIKYILRRKIHHATDNISWIFTAREHSPNPINRRITIRIPQAFVHRRNQVVMFLTIFIIIEIFVSRLQNNFARNFPFLLQNTRCFEQVERITQITITNFGNQFQCLIIKRNIRKSAFNRLNMFFEKKFNIMRFK